MSERSFSIPSPYEINLHEESGRKLYTDLLVETEAALGDSFDYGPYAEHFCELEQSDTALAFELAKALEANEKSRSFIASRILGLIRASNDPGISQGLAELWLSILEKDSTDSIYQWQEVAADSALEFDPEWIGEEDARSLVTKIDPVIVSRIIALADLVDKRLHKRRT